MQDPQHQSVAALPRFNEQRITPALKPQPLSKKLRVALGGSQSSPDGGRCGAGSARCTRPGFWGKENIPAMATENQQRRVRLTCKCGTAYTLNTVHDLKSQCANKRCRATFDMNGEGLWRYQESLIALMGALGLGREYAQELDFATRMSKKFASPYTIDVIEVPLEKPPDRHDARNLPRTGDLR